ncbi:MAG: sensor histidine kinase [Acidimicrobiales bacterium]
MSAEGLRDEAGAGGAGEHLAAVSHDLRQPLASIRSFAEMLLAHWADFSDRDKLEMLGQIVHDSKRAVKMVDELLDAVRLDAGQLRLDRSEVDLAGMAHRAVSALVPTYPDLDPDLQLRGLPLVVADPMRVEQVLLNLLENACKHGMARGVKVKGEHVGDDVVVAVSDSGPGISPVDLQHVTERFWTKGDGRQGGLGLGLWISKRVIEAHGGTMSVSSAPGQGTEVRFSLPVRKLAPAGKLIGQ